MAFSDGSTQQGDYLNPSGKEGNGSGSRIRVPLLGEGAGGRYPRTGVGSVIAGVRRGPGRPRKVVPPVHTVAQRAKNINLRQPPHLKKGAWQKGQSGNPAGRPSGSYREAIARARVRIIARTGMLPLDFLTAVYRDQLYEAYSERVAEDGMTVYYTPDSQSKRIPVSLEARVSAAISAAPYIHKKLPVGIELDGRRSVALTADKLRVLTTRELGEMLRIMDKIGVQVDVSGVERAAMNQEGRLLEMRQ